MKPPFPIRIATLLALVVSAPLFADEAATTLPSAGNAPSGSWKWSFTMPDGSKIEPRVKLKQEGATLTGVSVPKPGEEMAITEGSVRGDEVSWVVVRELEGRKVTTRYTGRVSGDALAGKIESDWSGEVRSYDWKAKRESTSPAGKWRWPSGFGRGGGGGGGRGAGGGGRGGGGGGRSDNRATFAVDGEKLTGKITAFGQETEITNGRFKDGEVTFDLVRDFRGTPVTTSFKGTVDGDVIKGDTTSDMGGEPRKFDWEATRVTEDQQPP